MEGIVRPITVRMREPEHPFFPCLRSRCMPATACLSLIEQLTAPRPFLSLVLQQKMRLRHTLGMPWRTVPVCMVSGIGDGAAASCVLLLLLLVLCCCCISCYCLLLGHGIYFLRASNVILDRISRHGFRIDHHCVLLSPFSCPSSSSDYTRNQSSHSAVSGLSLPTHLRPPSGLETAKE